MSIQQFERIAWVPGERDLKIIRRGLPVPRGAVVLLNARPAQTIEVEERILDGDTRPTRVFVAKRYSKDKRSVITDLLFPVSAEGVKIGGYCGKAMLIG